MLTLLSNRPGNGQFTLPAAGVTVSAFYRTFLNDTFNPNAVTVKRGAQVLSGSDMIFNETVITEVAKKQDAAA